MPNMDRTGPEGFGPMTGRGFGPCMGSMRRMHRRGYGRGFGIPISLTKDEEKKILEANLREIEFETDEIKRRLKEIE